MKHAAIDLLKVLSDQTRLDIINILAKQDSYVEHLASVLSMAPATVCYHLKKMEQAGYITRCRSHQDERVVEICLTDKGRELREKVKDIPSALGSCVNLSREEAQTMYRMLYCLLGTDEAMQVREA